MASYCDGWRCRVQDWVPLTWPAMLGWQVWSNVLNLHFGSYRDNLSIGYEF